MTTWQKIAAIFKDAAGSEQQIEELSLGFIVIPLLSDMIRDDGRVIAAVSKEAAAEGRLEACLVAKGSEKCVIVFPDAASADAVGERPLDITVRELFISVIQAPEISGLRLVYDIDENARTFETALIPRKWLDAAIQSGISASIPKETHI